MAALARRLYLRQLLSGRDFATGDQVAEQMVNFVYLIGDRATGEAVVVDPAYAVGEIVALAEADDMRITGVLATHHHPDHVGGSMMGHRIEGIAGLAELVDVPVHVSRHEARWVARTTGVAEGDLVIHDGGDKVAVGGLEVTILHTPGHTPGSQCFLVEGMLVSGDTLFLEGCGRTDLPGGDAQALFDSLRTLDSLPDDTVVLPGHRYSVPSLGTLAAVREINSFLKPDGPGEWVSTFSSR